ncbi:VanW family protein [Desulfurispora thermophila]|uniref:VanW family protein n=1 Tax=Desulfurispora thermophila TaxID=265470 RepID=UPI000379BAA5|nr:VanW family protein [Desulfurispora thermophila]
MSDRFFRVLIVCLAVVILTGEVVEKAYAGGGQGKDGEQLEQVRQVIFAEGVSCCWINGQATGIAMSLAPYTANGRLMVAVQDLCRALAGDAYTINWDEHNQKMNLTLRGLIFNLRVGQSMLEIARICPGEEGCAHKQEESRLMDASPALRSVGPRTISRGFVVSRSIVGDGKKYRYISDVGGGVCRAATVLHQAVARVKGVKIIERHRHVLPVPYAATGQDAAVWYGKQDYRFINKRAKPLLIKAWWDGEAGNRLIVALYENISP